MAPNEKSRKLGHLIVPQAFFQVPQVQTVIAGTALVDHELDDYQALDGAQVLESVVGPATHECCDLLVRRFVFERHDSTGYGVRNGISPQRDVRGHFVRWASA